MIIALLILLDLILVWLHIKTTQSSSILFNLDYEQNVPTIYQATKLILIGFLFFLHYLAIILINPNGNKLKPIFIIIAGIMFFWLGIDEVGQIHESFSMHFSALFPEENEALTTYMQEAEFESSNWLVYYSPMMAIGILAFLATFIYFFKTFPKISILLYTLGFFCFLIVPMLEFISTTPETYKTEHYELYIIIEEYLEMVGATFCFTAIYIVVRKDFSLLKSKIINQNGIISN